MGPNVGDPVKSRLTPHRRFFPPEGDQAESSRLRRLYDAEPENCRRRLVPFLRNLAYLGLIVAVSRRYHIEGRAFECLLILAACVLQVHYLAPYRWKKPIFLAASIGGLGWVFGPEVLAVVAALSVVLIGACRLPVSWNLRAGLLAALTVFLSCGRPEPLFRMVPSTVWPVLGSMFMFRMIIYMYELKHAKKPERLIDEIGYFFLLPNFCFMLFPVVDYRTMQRGYFADDVHAIQRRGLEMMFRGVVQLILYRLIDQELLISASEVHGPWSLVGFLAFNYLVYLQVSGQFHVACGMLHLFGYQLPDTHHKYLLATGFTDYWRRINIYWKDFMVRLVFNPVVFRLKRWPQPAALAAATVAVFVATWLLHGYQSFWLRGTWGFSIPDAVFWGVLGVLVLVNVQLDARRSASKARAPRKRDDAPGPRSAVFRALAVRSLQTAATFATITLLWSLWNSPSLAAWLDLLSRGLHA
jgi:D-alanyl-lipoteichoic acid acyltransferase DltB (MBOAT superfamily)